MSLLLLLRPSTEPAAPLTVALLQGATVIATRIISGLTTTETDYAFVLTAGERAAITDQTALRLRWTLGTATAVRVTEARVSLTGTPSTTGAALAGDVVVTIAATGALTVDKPLSGTAAVALVTSAALTVGKPLAGASSVAVTTNGALAAVGMSAASAVSVGTAGALEVPKPLSGAVLAAITVSAALTVAKPLAGNAALALTTAGALDVPKPLAGTVSVSVAAVGSVVVPKPLAGGVSVSVVGAGALRVPKPLSGVVEIAVTTSGALLSLTIGRYLNGVQTVVPRYAGVLWVGARADADLTVDERLASVVALIARFEADALHSAGGGALAVIAGEPT